jgi:hypothetical protein
VLRFCGLGLVSDAWCVFGLGSLANMAKWRVIGLSFGFKKPFFFICMCQEMS